MKLPRRKFLHLGLGATGLLLPVPHIASAETYPMRPVRIIIPFAPAGPTDVFGRLLAERLSSRLGKQFFVENIAGAGGNIGAGRAAKAAADGATMLIVANSYVVNPTLFD